MSWTRPDRGTRLAAAAGVIAAMADIRVAAETPRYPADVDKFIERVAWCRNLTPAEQKQHRQWACERLSADRKRLKNRYAKQREILEALDGDWSIMARRRRKD